MPPCGCPARDQIQIWCCSFYPSLALPVKQDVLLARALCIRTVSRQAIGDNGSTRDSGVIVLRTLGMDGLKKSAALPRVPAHVRATRDPIVKRVRRYLSAKRQLHQTPNANTDATTRSSLAAASTKGNAGRPR